MFKIAEKKAITWPVVVEIPQDGGKTTKQTFTGEFEIVDQDELNQLALEGADLLARVFTGWEKGVGDEEGKDLPFSEEMRQKLLKITYVRRALFEAYGQIQHGRAAPRKN